jgi:hypothetical protein
MSGVIQCCAARIDLVPQARNRAPEQSHCAGNMRRGHGCATGSRVTSIGVIASRTCACARSSDVGLYSVAAVPGDRTTAAKASNGIGSGLQGACRV